MLKAATLLITLPLIAAAAPPQTSVQRHHRDCQDMVDRAWLQHRMDTPSRGGQSFNSTRHETNRYAICSSIR